MSLPVNSITNNQSISSTPNSRNKKNVFVAILAILVFSTLATIAWRFSTNRNVNETEKSKTTVTEQKTEENNKLNESVKKELTKLDSAQQEKDALNKFGKHPGDINDKSKPFNILVLGIDKRYGGQTHWRTDVIQLVTISKDRKKVVITHIPRDLWAGSYKINALYNLQGPEAIKDKIEEITGQRPDRIIRFDFDAFVWAIDSIGGLTIDVPRSFTDKHYPDDRNGTQEVKTVSFEKGKQTMDGETALIYARSRKGDNGEGSDYARGTRQQLIMEAIVDNFFTKDTIFKPKTAEVVYKLATQKIYTDFTLTDTKVLFDLAKNYQSVFVSKLSLDTSNYLVTPSDRSSYGGAWTLIPKDGTYAPIHTEIRNMLE